MEEGSLFRRRHRRPPRRERAPLQLDFRPPPSPALPPLVRCAKGPVPRRPARPSRSILKPLKSRSLKHKRTLIAAIPFKLDTPQRASLTKPRMDKRGCPRSARSSAIAAHRGASETRTNGFGRPRGISQHISDEGPFEKASTRHGVEALERAGGLRPARAF